MPSVNPEILRWARETAGLSLEDAAAKLSLGGARGLAPEQRLAAYEIGEHEPSRPLLVRMAKQYRRPLLTFYLTKPPRLGERGEDYRTLPPEHSRVQDALLDALIRDLRARQELIRAALEEEDEAVRLPFVASMSPKDGPEAVLQSISETLHLELDRYRGRQGRGRGPSGFAYLREQAEKAGISWRRWGHEIGFGIGIAHGFATLGTIGFEGRFDYAAIGTVSNVASRLCDEAKPGQILISPRVLTKVENAVKVEPVGEFELKGIRRPLAAYNVLGALDATP